MKPHVLPLCLLADMLDWTAAWLLHGAPTLGKPTHFEAADGRF